MNRSGHSRPTAGALGGRIQRPCQVKQTSLAVHYHLTRQTLCADEHAESSGWKIRLWFLGGQAATRQTSVSLLAGALVEAATLSVAPMGGVDGVRRWVDTDQIDGAVFHTADRIILYLRAYDWLNRKSHGFRKSQILRWRHRKAQRVCSQKMFHIHNHLIRTTTAAECGSTQNLITR